MHCSNISKQRRHIAMFVALQLSCIGGTVFAAQRGPSGPPGGAPIDEDHGGRVIGRYISAQDKQFIENNPSSQLSNPPHRAIIPGEIVVLKAWIPVHNPVDKRGYSVYRSLQLPTPEYRYVKYTGNSRKVPRSYDSYGYEPTLEEMLLSPDEQEIEVFNGSATFFVNVKEVHIPPPTGIFSSSSSSSSSSSDNQPPPSYEESQRD